MKNFINNYIDLISLALFTEKGKILLDDRIDYCKLYNDLNHVTNKLNLQFGLNNSVDAFYNIIVEPFVCNNIEEKNFDFVYFGLNPKYEGINHKMKKFIYWKEFSIYKTNGSALFENDFQDSKNNEKLNNYYKNMLMLLVSISENKLIRKTQLCPFILNDNKCKNYKEAFNKFLKNKSICIAELIPFASKKTRTFSYELLESFLMPYWISLFDVIITKLNSNSILIANGKTPSDLISFLINDKRYGFVSQKVKDDNERRFSFHKINRGNNTFNLILLHKFLRGKAKLGEGLNSYQDIGYLIDEYKKFDNN